MPERFCSVARVSLASDRHTRETSRPGGINADPAVIAGFGDEWARFDQSELPDSDHRRLFASYFGVFPWELLDPDAQGMDVGCGSGRWAKLVAPRVGRLHCIDASERALRVAARNLSGLPNITLHQASVGALPLPDDSLDFGYSLGVLHHVPDTRAGLKECVRALRPGAPFLVYLYYAFDNRPPWFRAVWKLSDAVRRLVCRLPHGARYAASQALAAGVYWPLARAALLLERRGVRVESLPLSAYRHRSFYTMRTDALDRFGTTLEQRFSRAQIEEMMRSAGLADIRFHDGVPYWCAVGWKR